jgi:hypothetical protein
MATYTGVVTQSANGQVLTYTDTSSNVGTVTSRILNIYDSNEVLVDTINMGASLTATYNITTDVYLSFIETLVDDGVNHEITVNYLSTIFYEITFAPLIAAQNCDTDVFGLIYNLTRASLFKESAEIYAEFGVGQNAQANITQANFYLVTPYYA